MPHDPVQGRDRRRGAPTLDLETLPREVRSAVEAMVAGHEVTLRHEGRDLGALTVLACPPLMWLFERNVSVRNRRARS